MPWQVAVILDERSDPAPLLGQMPVWARSTPERGASAESIRADWSELWLPDPSYTLINTAIGNDPVETVSAIVPTIEMHHPRLACLHLIGVPRSEELKRALAEYGYLALALSVEPGVGFAKPMESLERIPDLELDAEGWNHANDLYSAFFRVVGAPAWHGRNFNALNDSISTGNINEIEVPYRLIVRHAAHANAAVRRMIEDFSSLIRDIQATGCPVSIDVHE